MKLKVHALMFFLASLGFVSMAWADVDVPEEIKKVAPIYEGAKIIQSMEMEGGAQVIFEVSAKPKEVVKFYKDAMKKKGWKVVMEMNMENNSMLNLGKNNLTLVVNAGLGQKGKTSVQLLLQKD